MIEISRFQKSNTSRRNHILCQTKNNRHTQTRGIKHCQSFKKQTNRNSVNIISLYFKNQAEIFTQARTTTLLEFDFVHVRQKIALLNSNSKFLSLTPHKVIRLLLFSSIGRVSSKNKAKIITHATRILLRTSKNGITRSFLAIPPSLSQTSQNSQVASLYTSPLSSQEKNFNHTLSEMVKSIDPNPI